MKTLLSRPAILLVFAITFLFCFASKADACTCAFGGGAPCQEYWRADAVFSGTIIGSRSIDVKDDSFKSTERQLRVVIKDAFRGIDGGQTDVITGWGGGDCGYEFKLGQTYLIYARRSNGKLYTSICSRTRPLSETADDIAFINSLSGAETGALVFGQVVKRNYFWKEGEDLYLPVPDAEVRIEGANEKREVRSNKDGGFRFDGLKPGPYKILLNLPDGLLRNSYVKDEGARVVENEVTVVAQGCGQSDFYLESDTRVTGTVFDVAGQPVPNLILQMRGANPNAETINTFLSAQTDQRGIFQFKVVPPGEYLLGFRILDSPSIDIPYPRTYYPGVPVRASARILTVKEGVGLHYLEMHMPAMLEQYEVEVQAVWSDGKPAPGVSIYLALMEGGETTGSASFRADAQGRFKLIVYDGLQYQVSAYPQGASGPEPQSPWVPVPAKNGPGHMKLILPGKQPK